METLFWLSIFVIVYTYFGYLAILYVKYKLGFTKFHCADVQYQPRVALIISMANEPASQIIRKIENTKALTYLKFKYEVVIAIDNPGSATMATVVEHMDPTWIIVHSDYQIGKESMQRRAVAVADAEIFVFTDVASMLKPNTIELMTRHFSNPNIGSVDGESKIISEDGTSTEGLYLKYENKIRELESKVGSLVTCGGCLFASRSNVVQVNFDHYNSQSDFGAALSAKLLGYRTILDREATATFSDLKDQSKEFNRKYRTILRGMNTLKEYRVLLNLSAYRFFAFQLWSHKIAKWSVPIFMILAFVSNLILVTTTSDLRIYDALMLAQLLFYLTATILIGSDFGNKFTKIITFFVSSNAAMLFALIDFLRGKSMMKWEASKR